MRHALIAISLAAHLVLVAWLVFPEPLEQVVDFPPAWVTLDVTRPLPCTHYLVIEHRDGCTGWEEVICRPAFVETLRILEDEIERHYVARKSVAR
jgi:hypothetical protein